MSASTEQYRRVQNISTDDFHDEDHEDGEEDDVMVTLPWRRQESPSFQRVATRDDEEHPEDPCMQEKMRASFSSASFDLEDEDDAELGRYNLDFTEGTVERLRAELSAGSTLEEQLEKGRLTLGIVWDVYRKARDETRRRRMERRLSLNSDWERVSVTAISYCDLTDRGMPVVILMLLIWIAISLIALSNPLTWTMLGVSLFAVRVLSRLVYWYVWGRHVQRKRKLTLEKYAESNGMAIEMIPDFAVKEKTEFVPSASALENGKLTLFDDYDEGEHEEDEEDKDNGGDEEDEDNKDVHNDEEDKEPLQSRQL